MFYNFLKVQAEQVNGRKGERVKRVKWLNNGAEWSVMV
jgi:hypothetical protein